MAPSGSASLTEPLLARRGNEDVEQGLQEAPSGAQFVETRMHAAGICCPAETRLINSILGPMPGQCGRLGAEGEEATAGERSTFPVLASAPWT